MRALCENSASRWRYSRSPPEGVCVSVCVCKRGSRRSDCARLDGWHHPPCRPIHNYSACPGFQPKEPIFGSALAAAAVSWHFCFCARDGMLVADMTRTVHERGGRIDESHTG